MKENYINDISTITKTDSTKSLISHEESLNEFNETCNIVGLELVKATHEKSTMNERFNNILSKRNMNIVVSCARMIPSVDFDNVECCSILEGEIFEIELNIIQI